MSEQSITLFRFDVPGTRPFDGFNYENKNVYRLVSFVLTDDKFKFFEKLLSIPHDCIIYDIRETMNLKKRIEQQQFFLAEREKEFNPIQKEYMETLNTMIPTGEVQLSSLYLIINKDVSNRVVEFFNELNFEATPVLPEQLYFIQVS